MSSPVPRRRHVLPAILCLIAGAFVHQASHACSVPVFRYGLEHWKADPYRLLIAHRGTLNAESHALVEGLRDAGTLANVSVRVADLAQSPALEALAAWEVAGSPADPWLIVQAPVTALASGVVWSGPLSAENVAKVIDSPARKKIAIRLGEGESAVWVLLEGGDKNTDDAAASLLQARLDYLATVMELPKLDEQDVRNGLVSVPPNGLQLSFSVVRLSRSDPAEQVFTQMLLATEPDLKESQGPIAFPVFGQGRALYALVGKGIRHETIDEAASFLVGSCSCQVKEKNPGADLLMAVDWKALVRDQASGLADLPAASEIVGGMPEAVTIAPQTAANAALQTRKHIQLNEVTHLTLVVNWPLIAGLVLCIAVVAGVVFMKRRAR